MRYGSSLNPKWIVTALWRKRRLIAYAISAVSLVWNAVVLAESLELRVTLTSLLHRLLPQVRDVGQLLVQRPVLVMLLNLIMLRMLVTSGLLGRGRAHKQHEGIRVMQTDDLGGRLDKTAPISHGAAQADDDDHSMITSVFKKRRSSAVLFAYTDQPGGGATSSATSSIDQGDALGEQKNIKRALRPLKRASLFTIEPLDSTNIEPTQQPSIMVLGAAQPKMGTPHLDGGLSIDDPSPVSHTNNTLDHFNDGRGSDYYDLNRQEFNERVETFITKFKRNLTMQRQDSLNRLVGLVGGGVKR